MQKFSIGLLCLFLISVGWYFNERVQALCQKPLSYSLGELDERFGLSREEALAAIDEAAAVWEVELQKDLFVYDAESDFSINFIFDERQAESDAEAEALERLEIEKQTLNDSTVGYERVKKDLEAQQETFNLNNQNYEADLEAYNTEVARYNEDGGAPPAEYENLEKERARLERVAKRLQEDLEKINSLVEEVNTESERHNAAVMVYNQHVRDFNNAFAGGREFTQGDYQGDTIHIYSFQSEEELTLVLAHELGHALSLSHVEDPTAVMYFMLTDVHAGPMLSAADIAEFANRCGDSVTWWQKFLTLFTLPGSDSA